MRELPPLPLDWDERFTAVMQAEMLKPFGWLTAHCWHACEAVIDAKRGEGVAPRFPQIKDAKSALRFYKRHGDGSMGSIMAQHFDEIGVLMAQRGDIGVVEAHGAHCAVICTGPYWWGRDVAGALQVFPAQIIRAFRT